MPEPKDGKNEKDAPEPKTDKPAAKKPAPNISGKLLALRLTSESIKPPAEQATARYWCGVSVDCPIQTIHAGGLDFPRSIQISVESAEKPGRMDLTDATQCGRIHWLTDAQREIALKSIAARVIRTEGKREFLLSTLGSSTRPYIARADDRPLGSVVYMVQVGEGQHVNRGAPHPEMLVR